MLVGQNGKGNIPSGEVKCRQLSAAPVQREQQLLFDRFMFFVTVPGFFMGI
ncbi:hypothetical protein NEIPOLOT_01964 [Neisseria polysaccharea ATCC 43768]|nr:hypothetical protein NEIPOLOT_01964 [Neisseria polysaccharea ATCC 43768]